MKLFKVSKSFLEIYYFACGSLIILTLPIYLFRILKNIPNIFINKHSTYAFSKKDASFRSWYTKIANDYDYYGRGGYSFDDGLGLSLGSRAYNNYATYFLCKKFGQLQMVLLGYLFLVISIIYLVTLSFELQADYIFLLMLISLSPMLIQIFFNLGKPEVIWWFIVPFISFYAFSESLYISGLLWSILAMVNAPIAFLTAVAILLPSILFHIAVGNELLNILFFIFACMPGVVKLFLRLLFMHKSDFLRIIGKEQANLWNRSYFNLGEEFLTYLIILFISYSISIALGNVLFLLISAPLILLNYSNWRLVYLNDTQSFMLLNFTFCFGLSCFFLSKIGLLLSGLICLRMIYIPIKINKDDNLFNLVKTSIEQLFYEFPFKRNFTYKDLENDALIKTIEKIPDFSRVIFVTEERIRSSKIRQWVETVRYKIFNKKIMHLNDIYGCMQSSNLSSIFNAKAITELSENNLIENLKFLCVDYLISFDSKASKRLNELNFCEKINNKNEKSIIFNDFTYPDLFKINKLINENPFSNFQLEGGKLMFISNIDGDAFLPFAFNKFLILNDKHGNQIKVFSKKNECYISDVFFCYAKFKKGNRYVLYAKNKIF